MYMSLYTLLIHFACAAHARIHGNAYVAVDYNILFEMLFYAANGTRSLPAVQKRAVHMSRESF